MYYGGSTIINSIEKLLREAASLFQNKPLHAISLCQEALLLSQECGFEIGIAKSKFIQLKANVFGGNIEASLELSQECLIIFGEQVDMPLEHAELLRYLAMLYYRLNNYEAALGFANDALLQFRAINYKEGIAKSLDMLGNIYSKIQDYPEAFSSFKQCIEIKKELQIKPESISVSLTNIGLLFMDLGDYEKSNRYIREARRLLENSEHQYSICVNLQNIGVIAGKMGQVEEAIGLLKQSLKISQANEMLSTEASILSNLSEFCYYSNRIEDSLQFAHAGIDICKRLKIRNNIYATCMVTIFRCHHANGELEVAAEIGKDCVPLCKDIGYNDLAMDLYKELMEVLEKLGRIHQALDVSKALVRLQSDIFQKKTDFSVFRVQSKLEVQMKEQELEMQRELIQQQEQHNKELTTANKELDRFVGMASHDLKEPIRTINSFSKILSKYITEEQKEFEFLYFIQEASDRMGTLVDDLLSFARAGKLNVRDRPVNLNDIMLMVNQNMRSNIIQTQTEITYGELPVIMAHTTPILQLFQNIIANAIKYSKDDVPPVIHIESTTTDDGTTIRISDNGLGIPENKVETIFEPFIRVHGKANKQGSGIGLATCRKLIDYYNGRIWATSEVGVGTQIHFFIPSSRHSSDENNQID